MEKDLQSSSITSHGTHNEVLSEEQNYDQLALVLQGGGALGSYQAGVYEALAKNNIEPDWIAGISIGALNTAIIAGNPPEKRVSQLIGFWETICSSPHASFSFDMFNPFAFLLDNHTRKVISGFEANKTMMNGQKGFFVPKFMNLVPLSKFHKSTPDKLSYYDTSKLKETLLKFADFDLINNGSIRVSLGVVNVKSGEFSYFDNTKETLKPEHFMASGALPPAFPAVEIDGQFYWDGGIVNNTPILKIIEENTHKNTFVLQVDLWNPEGKLPETFDDITERTKDIQFSSRSKIVKDSIVAKEEQSQMLKELLAHIPEEIRNNNPWCQKATEITKKGLLKIVQLIYQDKEYEGSSKDYEFSQMTMKEHWRSGFNDMNDKLKEISIPKIYNKLAQPLKSFINNIEKIRQIHHEDHNEQLEKPHV